jgi:hypothetical protein
MAPSIGSTSPLHADDNSFTRRPSGRLHNGNDNGDRYHFAATQNDAPSLTIQLGPARDSPPHDS